MGWIFIDGATRQDVIDELTETTPNHKTLAHTVRRDPTTRAIVLYQVCESAERRYIGVSVLATGPRGWGYKAMDESMGPIYYDCPLEYLDIAQPAPTEGFARQWRAKVRAQAKGTV